MAEEVGVPPVAEIPFRHVAVIMDGNRRWARKHNVDIIEGHRKGSEVFRESIKWCMQLGVKEYTVYAFSCENWKRSEKEVGDLMSLFSIYMNDLIRTMQTDKDSVFNQARLRFLGRHILAFCDRLSQELLASMTTLEEHSKNNTRLLVNVCLDYSGQWDIAQSCVRLMESELARNGKPLSIDVVVDQLDAFMSTGRSPVDVMIRTGGEHRVSNFLLWQIAYAELCVTDVFWPDFSFELMKSSLEEVAHRSRRFGK